MPDIVLRNADGFPVTYTGVNKVLLPTADGGTAEFSQGGGSQVVVPENDVTFYDYDGTIVASYTLEEASVLPELPAAPQHEGLVFQGWNWSLEDVKALTSKMNIGATYITDNGETRLYITVPANSEPGRPPARNVVPLYIQQTVSNGVTIDWGDGSAPETLAGTGKVNTAHTYAEAGDFVIRLMPAEGCELGFGNGSNDKCILGKNYEGGLAYANTLKSAEIGAGVKSISYRTFSSCQFLRFVVIPDNVKSVEEGAFSDCYSLSCIIIPSGVNSMGDRATERGYNLNLVSIPKSVTSLGKYMFSGSYFTRTITIPEGVTIFPDGLFQSCIPILSVIIPESVTSIGSYAISYCYSLSSITIPAGVTSIGFSAFASCHGVKEYHLKPINPPTIQSSTFSGIKSDCIIYVPKGSLSAYQTATNWSSTTIKSKLQEEPE